MDALDLFTMYIRLYIGWDLETVNACPSEYDFH